MFKVYISQEGVTLTFKVGGRNEILKPVKFPDEQSARNRVKDIRKAIRAKRYRYVYLCGNTGKGKIEVYDANGRPLCESHEYSGPTRSGKGLNCLIKYGLNRRVVVTRQEEW
jgi:hypothetical protein